MYFDPRYFSVLPHMFENGPDLLIKDYIVRSQDSKPDYFIMGSNHHIPRFWVMKALNNMSMGVLNF
jgi:hypothetical protein